MDWVLLPLLARMSEVDDWRAFRASREALSSRLEFPGSAECSIGVVAVRRNCKQLQEFEQPVTTDTLRMTGTFSIESRDTDGSLP
jgi:hypothetical protein